MTQEFSPTAPKPGIINSLIVIVFSILITLPLVAFWMDIHIQPPLYELRHLTPKPGFRLRPRAIAYSAIQFRDYFNDHFGFRSELQRLYASVTLWFGISPTDKVLLGRDGWLFLNKYDGSFDYFRNTKPFSIKELEAWTEIIEKRQQWLAQRGIKYLFTVAPNKHTIYPEYMPEGIVRVGTSSRLDQLIQYLGEHSDVKVVDLRPRLYAAKEEEREYFLYKKTGTHWTEWGAFLAYQEIANAVKNWFQDVEPLDWVDVEVGTMTGGGDINRMIGQEKRVREVLPKISVINSCAKQVSSSFPDFPELDEPKRASRGKSMTECVASRGPRAVMFRDSFATAMLPYLSENFSSILYVWKRPFDAGFVKAVKPEIVIQEVVERSLQSPPPLDIF